jgi:hypothetical protein
VCDLSGEEQITAKIHQGFAGGCILDEE